MTFFQALKYFSQEALLNLLRGWKVSLLAIFTIAISLFLTGVFLIVGGNLSEVVEGWRAESKIVLYLEGAASPQLLSMVEEPSWVVGVETVTGEDAKERFRQAFPSMADLLEGWKDDPLPASLEVRLDWDSLDAQAFESWLTVLRGQAAVSMIDDDRDWLNQLETVVLVLQGFGALLGGILLLTAIFTIASIIRLTAYLYRDEIAVMRLVGATEFFIRGPFYMEGLFQGLAGGVAACLGLFAAFSALQQEEATVLTSLLAGQFLSFSQIALLITVGGFAGLTGAVASLRRESLGGEGGDGWEEDDAEASQAGALG